MAGGYWHITDQQGRFCGLGTVENMGDAYEALEECYGMIQWLAGVAAGLDPAGPPRQRLIEEAMANRKTGLEIGGRNEPYRELDG